MKKMLLIVTTMTLLLVSNLFAQKEDRIVGASLSGDNSVPPVTSSATGTVTGVLTSDWTEFHYSITIEGLTPIAAHFHNGAFDETGGVVKALDFSDGMSISGVWSSSDDTQPFTTDLLDELLAGRIYANIHTSANTGGEIRGNIHTVVPFQALLSGDKIVPTPITSSGVGTGAALLVGSERVLSYGLNVTGLTPTVSHFHGGSATETGGVIKTIDLVDDNAVGEWLGDDAQSLTDSLISELLLGNVYMNVHTSANPGGEIRSQMERSDATTFAAFISGDNIEPEPISSLGTGLAVLTLNSARTEVEYDITISQITPTAAHFHNAGADITGGVVKTLDFVDGHASGVWSTSDTEQALTSELVDELLSGRLYVNVHTTTYPGGEIRGQVRTFSGFNAQLSGSQSVPAVFSLGSGTLTSTFFYTDSGGVLEYDITVEGLTIMASHFHTGDADETGDVVKTITFVGNSAHGVWSANDTQPLTDDLVDMLRSGDIYVNIHTSANPGGEIRGQLLHEIFEVAQSFPIISDIEDVPDDQGGWVYLRWLASEQDALGNITQYGISELNLANEWVSLGSVPSTQSAEYIFPAHTFQDSSDQGIYWSKFQVTAHTIDPEVFFSSDIDSGFSVDNLSPAVPSGLLASITGRGGDVIQLTWDAPVDADFEYFRIYRSTEPGFDPSGTEPYSESIGTSFIDVEVSIDQTYYYILSAVDSHGNESGFSGEVSATIVGIEEGKIIPSEYVLYDAFPNPFNPSTTIKYGLPYQSDATLIIYNLMGQEIVRWHEYNLKAGYYERTWNGTNKFGVPVVSGVYLYRFVAGDFVVTRKMVLLK